MSTQAISQVLLASCPSHNDSSSNSFDDIVKFYLDRSLQAREDDAWQSDGCLLTDMGEFFARAVSTLSSVAEGMMKGDHIRDNTKQVLAKMDEDDMCSDYHILNVRKSKERLLLSMQMDLHDFAAKIQRSWEEKFIALPVSAPTLSIQGSEMSDDNDSDRSDYRRETSISMTPTHSNSSSPASKLSHVTEVRCIEPTAPRQRQESEDSEKEEQFARLAMADMVNLSQRGKGSYSCHWGKKYCRKGGVHPSGELVLFERNCDFKAHLQKHGKWFKCERPGCANQGGFARIDQLRRHQETVRHNHCV